MIEIQQNPSLSYNPINHSSDGESSYACTDRTHEPDAGTAVPSSPAGTRGPPRQNPCLWQRLQAGRLYARNDLERAAGALPVRVGTGGLSALEPGVQRDPRRAGGGALPDGGDGGRLEPGRAGRPAHRRGI